MLKPSFHKSKNRPYLIIPKTGLSILLFLEFIRDHQAQYIHNLNFDIDDTSDKEGFEIKILNIEREFDILNLNLVHEEIIDYINANL